jgi:hypothetical protein
MWCKNVQNRSMAYLGQIYATKFKIRKEIVAAKEKIV